MSLRNIAIGNPDREVLRGAVYFSLEVPRTQLVANLLSRGEEQNLPDWAELLEKQPI